MTIHHADNFLDRMKRAMLDAEIMHHAERGDIPLDRLHEHLEAHGIDATREDVYRSVDKLLEERHLHEEGGRIAPTENGFDVWAKAVGIAKHFTYELEAGVQAGKAAYYPERRP